MKSRGRNPEERSLTMGRHFVFFYGFYKQESLSALASLPVPLNIVSFLMRPILYFAYGSNMNLDQMAMRCPGAELGPVGRLHGWKYFINGDGYAGIERAEGSEVLGCLWSLKEKHWRALDHYEGVAGGHYERIELDVEQVALGVTVLCWVYLSCNHEYGVPDPRYQQIVMDGARQVRLPADYLPVLECWANGCLDR